MSIVRYFARALRAFAISAVLFASSALHAGPIISNYPNVGDASWGALLGAATRSFAQGFTMPATGSYALDSATMRLGVNAAGGTFELELFSGSPNPSGAALVTFGVPTLNTLGIADYTFLPDAPFTLLPSTTYWLVAYSNVTGLANQITWEQSSPVGIIPTGIATYAGQRFNTPAVVPPTGPVGGGPATFQINATATAVPEPATAGLIAAALFALVCLRRRGLLEC